ncbi:MAG: PilX N-terminal domain-containing pilus assembly protein [Gammaproteobacteria bacterium]|nr:PilX N-terminal domain-containing pilus assembly protein [Gammaproteobacteria bacterium]
MTSLEVQTMNPIIRSLGNQKSLRRQRGVVLIVSLILLLVVTLLAVSSMQGTALEEKMAGNTRDRNLAFQTTESAIREAETYIESVVSLGSFNGAAGLFGLTDIEPYYAMGTTWSDATQHVVADSGYGAYARPQYFIKHFTTVKGTEGAMNMSGYGDNKGTGDVSVFKITSRGTGGSADSAEVILRSHYGRIF